MDAAERALRAEEAEEEAELEREIALLTRQQSRLTSRVTTLQRTRDEYHREIASVTNQRRELERLLDGLEEDALAHATKHPSQHQRQQNRLHPLARLQADATQMNRAANESLEALALTATQVEEMLALGRVTTQSTDSTQNGAQHDQTKEAQPRAQRRRLSANGFAADLPSMSTEALSAFDATDATDAFTLPASSSAIVPASVLATSNSVNAPSSASAAANSSPYTLHQRELLASYFSLDDNWARTLNQLFRALFGGASAASTLAENQAERQTRAELESLVQATPHGKQAVARMRAATTANTLTPAKGRIGALPTSTLARTNSMPQIPETPPSQQQQESTDSFRTPPSHAHSNSNDVVDESSTVAAAACASSSLTPAQHAHFTAELTRLYDSFPSSQEYWLCHNLLFLSVKARITEQHALMVREEAFRTLTRTQVNEALAELGLQAAALSRQLATLLDDDPSRSNGFPALWQSLRSLQLLELLRADLSFACARQTEYLARQADLQQELHAQRARHEVVLGAFRLELARVDELRQTLQQLEKELTHAASLWRDRKACYAHLSGLHASTATMYAPSRLTLDARASFLQRALRLAQSGHAALAIEPSTSMRASHAHPTEALSPRTAGSTTTGVSSFDALLDATGALTSYALQFGASMRAAADARAEHLARLRKHATEARRTMLDDAGADVSLEATTATTSSTASAPSEPGATTVERLRAHPFIQLHATAMRTVDTVADGLNALAHRLQSQRTALDGGLANDSDAGAVDLATRTVWQEFIQAPDVLDQRIAQLKRKLATLEART